MCARTERASEREGCGGGVLRAGGRLACTRSEREREKDGVRESERERWRRGERAREVRR